MYHEKISVSEVFVDYLDCNKFLKNVFGPIFMGTHTVQTLQKHVWLWHFLFF